MVTLIAAIDPNNVIGHNGKTPWHIPEELKLFKETTYGHAIIVGRKTYESIGHALPGRTMYVLSHNCPIASPLLDEEKDGVKWCSSIAEALDQTKHERSVFVIGGGQVYAEMMPLADEMRISHIHQEYSGDVLFPKINPTIWREVSRIEYPLFTHIHYTRS